MKREWTWVENKSKASKNCPWIFIKLVDHHLLTKLHRGAQLPRHFGLASSPLIRALGFFPYPPQDDVITPKHDHTPESSAATRGPGSVAAGMRQLAGAAEGAKTPSSSFLLTLMSITTISNSAAGITFWCPNGTADAGKWTYKQAPGLDNMPVATGAGAFFFGSFDDGKNQWVWLIVWLRVLDCTATVTFQGEAGKRGRGT